MYNKKEVATPIGLAIIKKKRNRKGGEAMKCCIVITGIDLKDN